MTDKPPRVLAAKERAAQRREARNQVRDEVPSIPQAPEVPTLSEELQGIKRPELQRKYIHHPLGEDRQAKLQAEREAQVTQIRQAREESN